MKENQDVLINRMHAVSELYEHLYILHEKTRLLCEEIFNNGIKSVKLVELRLSEIYSLLNSAKLFLSLKEDLYHYEISSLLNFCDSTYFQLYEVARDDDENTSWLYGEFQNFTGQYKIVEQMLKAHIDEMKSIINSATAD